MPTWLASSCTDSQLAPDNMSKTDRHMGMTGGAVFWGIVSTVRGAGTVKCLVVVTINDL